MTHKSIGNKNGSGKDKFFNISVYTSIYKNKQINIYMCVYIYKLF